MINGARFLCMDRGLGVLEQHHDRRFRGHGVNDRIAVAAFSRLSLAMNTTGKRTRSA